MHMLQGDAKPVDQFSEDGILSRRADRHDHGAGAVFPFTASDSVQHSECHVQIDIAFGGYQFQANAVRKQFFHITFPFVFSFMPNAGARLLHILA